MWKAVAAYFTGMVSALVVAFAAFELASNRKEIKNQFIPEAWKVSFAVTIHVPEPIEERVFAGMDAQALLDRLDFLVEPERAALESLFHTSMLTEVTLSYDAETELNPTSSSFYIREDNVYRIPANREHPSP